MNGWNRWLVLIDINCPAFSNLSSSCWVKQKWSSGDRGGGIHHLRTMTSLQGAWGGEATSVISPKWKARSSSGYSVIAAVNTGRTGGGGGAVNFLALICGMQKGARNCHVKCTFPTGALWEWLPFGGGGECLAGGKCFGREGERFFGTISGSVTSPSKSWLLMFWLVCVLVKILPSHW